MPQASMGVRLCLTDQEPSIVTIPFLPANVLIRTRLLNADHAGPRFARYGAMPPAIVYETGQVKGPVCGSGIPLSNQGRHFTVS
ncbi:hypothetical protein BJF96_g5287 [Verticillium dahliae]|uniref:Uncharacterized protein n=1 Tax=Verticillium dahliae TaxID=27337 RepID=A0AA44WIK8_VERDA|nr:hypothetical protein BJF96_g5287 [Verticillium dahliae]